MNPIRDSDWAELGRITAEKLIMVSRWDQYLNIPYFRNAQQCFYRARMNVRDVLAIAEGMYCILSFFPLAMRSRPTAQNMIIRFMVRMIHLLYLLHPY